MKSVIKYVILKGLRLLITFKAKKYESDKVLEICVILSKPSHEYSLWALIWVN